MVNPEQSSKLSLLRQPKVMQTFSPLLNKISNSSMARSLYIYLKLFIFFPLKYLILLYIFILIYYILGEAYKYGMMTGKKFYKFFNLIVACAQMDDSCKLNLIIFSVPDIFKLFTGLLDFVLGFIYLCVTVGLLIASAICLIPFSFILPHYKAII